MYIIYLHFKSNNTFINIVDIKTNKSLFTSSFKRFEIKKYREKNVIKTIIEKLISKHNIKTISIAICGFNINRYKILHSIFEFKNINYTNLYYIQKKPFNGCKKKKEKRL